MDLCKWCGGNDLYDPDWVIVTCSHCYGTGVESKSMKRPRADLIKKAMEEAILDVDDFLKRNRDGKANK